MGEIYEDVRLIYFGCEFARRKEYMKKTFCTIFFIML